MAISRTKKEAFVAKYTELLSDSNGFAIVQTSGMSVPQTQALRNQIREAGGQYVVAKNSLIRIALQQNEWVVPDDLLNGPTAIVFGGENFPGVAKSLLKHIKDEKLEEKMAVSGGVLTGDILDTGGVEAVSKLPSLDELRAQLAGLVVSPAQGIVNVLQSANSQIVNVLHSYVEKHEGEGEAA